MGETTPPTTNVAVLAQRMSDCQKTCERRIDGLEADMDRAKADISVLDKAVAVREAKLDTASKLWLAIVPGIMSAVGVVIVKLLLKG